MCTWDPLVACRNRRSTWGLPCRLLLRSGLALRLVTWSERSHETGTSEHTIEKEKQASEYSYELESSCVRGERVHVTWAAQDTVFETRTKFPTCNVLNRMSILYRKMFRIFLTCEKIDRCSPRLQALLPEPCFVYVCDGAAVRNVTDAIERTESIEYAFLSIVNLASASRKRNRATTNP